MTNLNNINSPISREERNKLNENWQLLTQRFSDFQRHLNLLAGEDVEGIITNINERIAETDAALQQIEIDLVEVNGAADNANAKAELAQTAADIAEQITTLAQEKVDFIEEHEEDIVFFTSMQNNLQAQVDQLVISGDSSPEAAQARVGTDGTQHNTLKERLDSEIGQVTTQLAQKAEKSEITSINDLLKDWRIRMPVGYGQIKLPSDFIPVDFTLTRNRDNTISHNIDLDQRYRNNNIQEIIYVDITSGDNTNGTGSETSPYKTPNKAFEKAVSSTNQNIKIIINADELLRNEFFLGLDVFAEFTNKNIVVTTKDNKKIPVLNGDSTKRPAYQLVGANVVLPNWTLTSGNVYQTARSNTAYVVDTSFRSTENGLIQKMIPVTSIEQCQATPGSYFINGSTVHVHTFDSRPADGSLTCILKLTGNYLMFRLRNSRLFIENFEFFIHDGATWRGDITSHFIAHNCDFGETIAKNSLTHLHTGKIYMLNCSTHDSFFDGFNYHYPPGVDNRNCLVFEYNCFGYNNGNEPGGTGNNYTTAHDGCSIIRVNSVGKESQGVVCADVNGSYSILIDCEMNDSKLPSSNIRSASYQFTTDSGLQKAKALLINSGGTSPNWSILADEQKGTELILETWYEGLNVVKTDVVL